MTDEQALTGARGAAPADQDCTLAPGREVGSDAREALNEHVIIPALLTMLGHVTGHHVLDLACGRGALSRRLADHGAHVTAVDVSNELITAARTREIREQRGITYHFSDSADMAMVEDSTFDEVVCHMALVEIENLAGTVAEVARVIKPGGRFVFSINHPCFCPPNTSAGSSPGHLTVDNYFNEGPRGAHTHAADDRQPAFHRTLSTYINAVAGRGFTIRRIAEPRPSEEIALKHPQLAAYRSVPVALILEAIFPHV